jgi:hypothetical protein
MNYKQIGIFLGVVFVLYFLVGQQTEARDALRDALGGVGDAAQKLAEFMRMLVR